MIDQGLTPVVLGTLHLDLLEEAAAGRGMACRVVAVHLEIDTGDVAARGARRGRSGFAGPIASFPCWILHAAGRRDGPTSARLRPCLRFAPIRSWPAWRVRSS